MTTPTPPESLREALVSALQEAAEAEADAYLGDARPVKGTWGDRILEAFDRHGISVRLASSPDLSGLAEAALAVREFPPDGAPTESVRAWFVVAIPKLRELRRIALAHSGTDDGLDVERLRRIEAAARRLFVSDIGSANSSVVRPEFWKDLEALGAALEPGGGT